jgi:uncharacterized protein
VEPAAASATTNAHSAGYLIGFLPTSSYEGDEFLWFKQRRSSFIYVDQIAIASSHSGHRIGHRLYSELARWSSDNACTSMVWEVNLVPPNPGSLAFHHKYGFSEIGRLIVPDGREVVLLECLGR